MKSFIKSKKYIESLDESDKMIKKLNLSEEIIELKNILFRNDNRWLKLNERREFLKRFKKFYDEHHTILNRILKEKEKEESSYKKDFFHSGKLRFEVPLVGGVENGLSKTYYTTGELKKTVPYKNGKKQGDCNEYYKSGVLKSTTPYKNGKMHGVVKTWHYSKKMRKLKSEQTFVNGLAQGVFKYYNARNGLLGQESSYENGKKHGVEKQYLNGKLWNVRHYKNNRLFGYEDIYNKAGLLIKTIYHPSKFENAVKFAINKVVLPFLLIIFVLSLILGFGYLFPTVLGCLFMIFLYAYIPILIIIILLGLFK